MTTPKPALTLNIPYPAVVNAAEITSATLSEQKLSKNTRNGSGLCAPHGRQLASIMLRPETALGSIPMSHN